MHVDKSFTKIQARVRPPPPFRQCLHFGSIWTWNPSLILSKHGTHLNFYKGNFPVKRKSLECLGNFPGKVFRWRTPACLPLPWAAPLTIFEAGTPGHSWEARPARGRSRPAETEHQTQSLGRKNGETMERRGRSFFFNICFTSE